MRKIEQRIVDCIDNGTYMSAGHDRVTGEDGYMRYYLHGSLIAKVYPEEVSVSACGWQTTTTKSRLNAILGHFCNVGITQKDFVWYIGGAVFADGMSFKRVR